MSAAVAFLERLEAASLQEDLRRAEIKPFALVINASLAAARPTDLILRARAAAEIVQFENVRTHYAERIACVPFQAEEPIGAQRLWLLASESRRVCRERN